jgi:type VI protein secretion system component VasA
MYAAKNDALQRKTTLQPATQVLSFECRRMERWRLLISLLLQYHVLADEPRLEFGKMLFD